MPTKRDLMKIGRNAYACVKEMVDALHAADAHTDEYETAREAIEQDALSVEVRSGWCSPGSADLMNATEYCLLLGTGGPAVRIVGDLDSGEPTTAWLEVQDWGTPWTVYLKADSDVLLDYARCFYFGEG